MPQRKARKRAMSPSGSFAMPLKKQKKQAWLNRNRALHEFVMKRGKKWPDYGEVGHPSGAGSLGFHEFFEFTMNKNPRNMRRHEDKVRRIKAGIKPGEQSWMPDYKAMEARNKKLYSQEFNDSYFFTEGVVAQLSGMVPLTSNMKPKMPTPGENQGRELPDAASIPKEKKEGFLKRNVKRADNLLQILGGQAKNPNLGQGQHPHGFYEFRSKRDYKKNLRNTNRTPHSMKGRKKKRPPRKMALRARKNFADWHDWFPDEKTTKREWKSWYPDDKGRPPAGNFLEFKSAFDVAKPSVAPYSVQHRRAKVANLGKPANPRPKKLDPNKSVHGYMRQRIPDYFDFGKNPKTAAAIALLPFAGPVSRAASGAKALYGAGKAIKAGSLAEKSLKASSAFGSKGTAQTIAKGMGGKKAASRLGGTPKMDRARASLATAKKKAAEKLAKKGGGAAGKIGKLGRLGGMAKSFGRYALLDKALGIPGEVARGLGGAAAAGRGGGKKSRSGVRPENMIRKIRRSKADSVGGVAGAISRHHAKGQQEESKFKRIRRSVGGGLRRTASAFERLGQRRKREIEDQQRIA